MYKTEISKNEYIEYLVEKYSDMVYRLALSRTRNKENSEDVFQEVFLRISKRIPDFESEEHEKAWLIRTATNICKNALRHWWRRRENIEDFHDLPGSEDIKTDEVLQTVMDLPDKYKAVVYLYYYEGYSSVEIAEILKKPRSTVRNYLHEARAILKERLGDDFDEEQ